VRPDTDGAHAMPGGGILVDTVAIYRTAREVRTFCNAPWTIAGAVYDQWYNINLYPPAQAPVFRSHDWGHNAFTYSVGAGGTVIPREDGSFEVITAGFRGSGLIAKEPGTYLITAAVALHVDSATPPAVLAPMARVVRDATYFSSSQQYNVGGVPIAQANGGVWVPAATFDPALPGLDITGMVSVVLLAGRAEMRRDERLCLEWWRGEDTGAVIEQLSAVGTSPEVKTWWNVRMGLAE